MESEDRSRSGARWSAREAGPFAVPLLVATLLFAPMLDSGSQFFLDWTNSYWLILTADPGIWPLWFFGPIEGLPALEPWFVYYGGYWFYLMASLSHLGLDPLLLYRISYLLLAVGMASGVYYLAIKFGVATWASSLLATLALAIPYYLTNAYGRGAYTEFIFVSLIPVSIAACVAFYSATRLWQCLVSAIIAIAATTLLLTTHMASLIMIFDLALAVAVIGLCCLLVITAVRPSFPRGLRTAVHRQWRRILALGLLLLAAALLAFPQTGLAVLTSGGTQLAITDRTYALPELSTLSQVFALSPRVHEISTTPDLKPQTATWVALWVGITVLLSWHVFSTPRRLALVLSLSLLLFCVAMTSWTWLFMTLPDFMAGFQFPYRFVSYLSLSLILICGVLLSSNYLRHGSGVIRQLLLSLFVLAVVVTTIGAFSQTRTAETYPDQADLSALSPYELPPTWYAPLGSFRQNGEARSEEAAELMINAQSAYHFVARIRCTGAPRTVINVANSGPLITMRGSRIVGTSSDGLLIVDTSSCKRGEPLRFTVEQASENNPGRVLILFALLASVILIVSSVWLVKAGKPVLVQER